MTQIKSYRVYTLRDNRAIAHKLPSVFQSRKMADDYADAIWRDMPHEGLRTGACVVVEPVLA